MKMPPDEAAFVQAIATAAPMPVSTVHKAWRCARSFIAATLPPGFIHIPAEELVSCVAAHPQEHLELFSDDWYAHFMDCVADGFDGCPGVGVDDARLFVLTQTYLASGHDLDIVRALRRVANLWRFSRMTSENVN